MLTDIFKAYDIRGIVDTQLSTDITHSIGKALGSMAVEQHLKGLVVGCDGRISSPILATTLIAGILSTGCNVYDIGAVTTAMLYFANYELKTYSGIMITGSHNPPEYNGFKIVLAGDSLCGERLLALKQRIEKNHYAIGNGSHITLDISEIYTNKILADIKIHRRMSVAVDCGSGIAGVFAPKIYRRLGNKVYGLFCEVDGNFPHHHPDPANPANLRDLQHALTMTDAELGLAFDGDGDRLGVVAKNGEIIYPDRQMMLYAADVLSAHPRGKIVYDVKSTRLLAAWIKEHNGEPVMSRTGHSFIKTKIKEIGAVLAGEMSGHIFFNDRWYGIDDAIYAGARLLEILSQVKDPSALLQILPNSIASPEIVLPVPEGQQHQIIEKLHKQIDKFKAQELITIDGIRAEYADGFGLVRASNTTAAIVCRFEADTKAALVRIKKQFRIILAKHIKDIEL